MASIIDFFFYTVYVGNELFYGLSIIIILQIINYFILLDYLINYEYLFLRVLH